jgi:MFS family permease
LTPHSAAYARTLQYTPKEGANFIAVNNVSNAIGKIVVGMLADKLGRINMLLATTAASAVVSYAFWLPSTVVHSLAAGKGLFVTYAIFNGALTGPYVSLFPTFIVELFGPHHFASINGVLYMSRGVGTLLGTPTAGALLRGSHSTDPGAYFHMSVMVAVLLTAASAATLWIRVEAKKS